MAVDPGICLMTVAQVAKILNYSAQTVISLIRRGELLGLRIGREYRVTRMDLEVFLESRRINGPNASTG
jgi:excisionase family DNA binding protein